MSDLSAAAVEPELARRGSSADGWARWGLSIHVLLVGSAAIWAYLGGGSVGWGSPFRFRHFDKVLHFFLVGGVSFWISIGWGEPRIRWRRLGIPLAVLVPLVIATIEEGLQFFSPYRNADPLDFLANTSGLIVFWLLARLLASMR